MTVHVDEDLTAEQIRENRLTWAAALRSNKYRQTRKTLVHVREDGDQVAHSYCCLGVFGVLNPDVEVDSESKALIVPDYSDGRVSISDVLNATLRNRLGMSVIDMELLVDMNDRHLADFSAIANVVEQWAKDDGTIAQAMEVVQ